MSPLYVRSISQVMQMLAAAIAQVTTAAVHTRRSGT